MFESESVVAELSSLTGGRAVTIAPFLLVDLATPGTFQKAKISYGEYDVVMCNDAMMSDSSWVMMTTVTRSW